MAFRRDNRGVSQVVGFILIFALFIILLSLYQAQIVPAQNAETEYQHSQAVEGDMIELRNALQTADTTGQPQFIDVVLGTQYKPRIFALTPPAATGTIATSDPRPITVTDGGGTPVSNICPGGSAIETRSLSYTPSYFEYDNAPRVVYENTVLYLQFDNRTIPLTGQQLVTNSGEAVRLSPLNSTLHLSSSRTVSIEAIPGQQNTVEVTNGNITTPTGLSEQTWESLLAGQLQPSAVTVSNDNLTLQTSGTITVGCSPIGLNEPPAGGARLPAGLEINPTGNVQIRDFNRPSNDEIEVTFNNTASRDFNATQARLAFYHNPADTGGEIGPIDMIDPETGNTSATFPILGEYQTLNPQITFTGNETETTVTFRNPGGEKFDSRDFFVINVVFETGERGTYFIDVPA